MICGDGEADGCCNHIFESDGFIPMSTIITSHSLSASGSSIVENDSRVTELMVAYLPPVVLIDNTPRALISFHKQGSFIV